VAIMVLRSLLTVVRAGSREVLRWIIEHWRIRSVWSHRELSRGLLYCSWVRVICCRSRYTALSRRVFFNVDLKPSINNFLFNAYSIELFSRDTNLLEGRLYFCGLGAQLLFTMWPNLFP
jgi:hypothetical protein